MWSSYTEAWSTDWGYTPIENCFFLTHKLTIANSSTARGGIVFPNPLFVQPFGLAWVALALSLLSQTPWLRMASLLCSEDKVSF